MRLIVKVVFFVALIAFGRHMWNKTMADEAATAAESGANENGFIPTVMVDGAERNVVLVLTPKNCPSEEAQRSRELDAALEEMGIPHRMGDSFEISSANPEDRQLVENAIRVFKQGPPAVYINGMAKSNPTAAEVAAEYRRTKAARAS